MPSIALINIGRPDRLGTDPLGIETLAGSVTAGRLGPSVTLVDQVTFSPGRGAIESILPRGSYDFIGLSSMWANFENAATAAAAARARFPRATIVIGGSIVESLGGILLEDISEIDLAVRGEGEAALASILSGEAACDLPNTYYRDGSKVAFTGTVQSYPLAAGLPDRSLLVNAASADYPYVAANIEVSRGCDYGACTFCHLTAEARFHRANGTGPYVRYRAAPMVNAIDDYRTLVNIEAARINFVDEEFFGGRGQPLASRGAKFLREVIKGRIGIDIPKNLYVRSADVDEDSIGLMRRAGVTSVFIGIESGNRNDLRLFGKGIQPAQNAKAIRLLRSAGIRLKAGFIMLHPLSEPLSILENIAFLEENSLFASVSNVLNIMDVIPGSSYCRMIEHLAPQLLTPRNPHSPNYGWLPANQVLRAYWPLLLQVCGEYSRWVDEFRTRNAMNSDATMSAHSRELLGEMNRRAAGWLKEIALTELGGSHSAKINSGASRFLSELNVG